MESLTLGPWQVKGCCTHTHTNTHSLALFTSQVPTSYHDRASHLMSHFTFNSIQFNIVLIFFFQFQEKEWINCDNNYHCLTKKKRSQVLRLHMFYVLTHSQHPQNVPRNKSKFNDFYWLSRSQKMPVSFHDVQLSSFKSHYVR